MVGPASPGEHRQITQRKIHTMTYAIKLLAGAAILTLALAGQAVAQVPPQTVTLTTVETTSLATGYRTSSVVGATVFNEAGETVGKVDDLIITPDDKVPFAVLSIGGFLGMGEKYVVVSYGAFEMKDKKMTLRGATKESLMALPDYKYAS